MKWIILLPILFIACNTHPKENDWYEHKGTGKRIQIVNIGTGKYLNSLYFDIVNIDRKATKKIRTLLPPIYNYDPNDSTKQCVSFQEMVLIQPPYHYRRYDIISLETLMRDYILVN